MSTIVKRRGIMFKGYIFLPDKEYLRVVNDELDQAVEKVNSILLAEKCRVDRIEEVFLNNQEEVLHEGLLDNKIFDNSK